MSPDRAARCWIRFVAVVRGGRTRSTTTTTTPLASIVPLLTLTTITTTTTTTTAAGGGGPERRQAGRSISRRANRRRPCRHGRFTFWHCRQGSCPIMVTARSTTTTLFMTRSTTGQSRTWRFFAGHRLAVEIGAFCSGHRFGHISHRCLDVFNEKNQSI